MTTDSLQESQMGSPVPALCAVPEGWFSMGCAEGRDDEKPVHRVWVEAFNLAKYQTTNAEYAAFLAATAHPAPTNFQDPNFSHPRQPVTTVSWHDAAVYCEWLSSATGRQYRLPTEAEWERAARGGCENTTYPWGNAPPDELPDYAARWKHGPEQVGLYEPNSYGIYNLGDNVHEWCADWYNPAYYASSPERNPRGPEFGVRKASRGGSWRHHIKVTRTAARSSIPPELRYADYGFRVACSS
jgi:sulfatase modifying factor 1